MRTEKWKFYVSGMQGHGGIYRTTHTIEGMKFLTDIIPSDKYNKILNIGVGEGLETSILKQLGYSPTGIITGEDNKKWAKENYPGIEFIDCDMHDLPFPSNSFDAIYASHTLEHAYALFIFLLECYCVLKPKGLFYTCGPVFSERHIPNDPVNMDAGYVSHHHPAMFTQNTYRQMFEKTGFNILKQEDNAMSFLLEKGPITNLHAVLYRIVEERDRFTHIG